MPEEMEHMRRGFGALGTGEWLLAGQPEEVLEVQIGPVLLWSTRSPRGRPTAPSASRQVVIESSPVLLRLLQCSLFALLCTISITRLSRKPTGSA